MNLFTQLNWVLNELNNIASDKKKKIMTFVPLISSGVSGPLGVKHLPRQWLKLSLGAWGKLSPRYRAVDSRFNHMVLDSLRLSRDAVIKFIRDEHPTYTQFEGWISDQPGVKLDLSNIRQLNEAIVSFIQSDSIRLLIFNRCGLSDKSCQVRDAVGLSQLYDWQALHSSLFNPENVTKLVPLIGSGVAGPLGVCNLPRLWLKTLFEAKGRLAPGYSAVDLGFDPMVLDGLELSKEAVTTYIHGGLPTYTQFEEWIKKQPGVKLGPSSILKLNEDILNRSHYFATRMVIFDRCKLTEEKCLIRDAVGLNQLEDWKAFHESVLNP